MISEVAENVRLNRTRELAAVTWIICKNWMRQMHLTTRSRFKRGPSYRIIPIDSGELSWYFVAPVREEKRIATGCTSKISPIKDSLL